MNSWISFSVATLLSGALATTPARTIPSAHQSISTERARLDSLADATIAQLSRFANRRAAIAEGYRRIGTDFPSMGEHWLNVAVLHGKRLDPSRPTVLAYATIDGSPQLIGVGYVVTTTGSATSDAPGWPTYWHEHSGALNDESGAHVGVSDTSSTATHVWVLHIWAPLANPLGRYDADNWALPFARAGIAPPAGLDHEVGRALSLTVAEGDAYLGRVLTHAGLRVEANAARVDSALASARAASTAIITRARSARSETLSTRNHPLEAPEAESLRRVWQQLATDLRAVLGTAVDPLLSPPHRHHGSEDSTSPR